MKKGNAPQRLMEHRIKVRWARGVMGIITVPLKVGEYTTSGRVGAKLLIATSWNRPHKGFISISLMLIFSLLLPFDRRFCTPGPVQKGTI